VTLGGNGATAGVLGSLFAFTAVRDGRATLRVDDQDVSCAEGETVVAGGLQLRCRLVTGDSVTFDVSRR
jgi:hypothetical protein